MLQNVNKVSEAINSHVKWMETIQQNLICDIKPAEELLSENAHQLCEFGKWLEENKDSLKDVDLNIFYEVYEKHKKLHQEGKEILELKFVKKKNIPVFVYNNFLNSSKEIKKSLRKFRAKLYGSEE